MIKLTEEQKKIAEHLDGRMRARGLDPRRRGLGAHYDRDGDPITFGEWAALIESGEQYRRVAETTVETQFGKFWVSTVWLGIDHSLGARRPLIFETMIQRGRDNEWLGPVRYQTEAEAKVGHEVAAAIAAGGALNFVDDLGEMVHGTMHDPEGN